MSVDPRNFLFNSEYQIDKIAGYASGSISVPSGGARPTVTINHTLSCYPLCMVKWSLSSSFVTSYEDTELTATLGYLFNVYSTTSTIVVSAFDTTWAQPTRTLYYRILYFLPSNVNVDVPTTQLNIDKFTLNTDYNYTKIALQGTVSGSLSTVTHNLGYYPQVEAWVVNNATSRCYHIKSSNISMPTWDSYLSLSTSTLTMRSIYTNATWHYRIYADEN